MDLESIVRQTNYLNWVTITLVLNLSLLAIAKTTNPIEFQHFIRLFKTSKYIVLGQKQSKLTSLFNVLLTLFQLLSASIFLFICIDTFFEEHFTINRNLFFSIFIFYSIFFICKILTEKTIGVIFSIEQTINEYLFHKISYRNFFGILLFPFELFFIYTAKPSKITLLICLCILIILNVTSLFSAYKKNENLILGQLFYFILYLCTLEITPYFILYKLII